MKKAEERDTEIAALNQAIHDVRQRRAALEPILARQEDEAIDARRIVGEQQKLRDALATVVADIERAEREQKEVERAVGLKHERVESALTKYNDELDVYTLSLIHI